MSLSDFKLQYDQASAVLPIIQRKYSDIALPFLIPLEVQIPFAYHFLYILNENVLGSIYHRQSNCVRNKLTDIKIRA
jgi:hypothetical protein